MIKPTVGRIVWMWPNGRVEGEQPFAAIVTHVHSDEIVNLCAFTEVGAPFACTSMQLFQGIGDVPDTAFCEWMPHQLGQAKKTEEALAKTAFLDAPIEEAPKSGDLFRRLFDVVDAVADRFDDEAAVDAFVVAMENAVIQRPWTLSVFDARLAKAEAAVKAGEGDIATQVRGIFGAS
jgi:hypothetical protein